MVILTILSLLTTPTLAGEVPTSQNETAGADAALRVLQSQLQRVNLSVSKKLAGPVTFTMNLHEQKSSLHYRSPQQLETDLAVHHGQQSWTVTLYYRW